MTLTRIEIFTVIGALLVFLLQIIIAPNIAIGSVYPNIALVYVALVGILRPRESWPLLPFLLGLALDLFPGAYVGLNALIFVLVWFATSRAFMFFNNDTLFVPIAILLATLFGAELLYGLLLSNLAFNSSLISLFTERSIPCAIYDFVVSLILFIPLSKLFHSNQVHDNPSISQVR